MKISLIRHKAEIYKASARLLDRSRRRLLIVERSASLLLGPRNNPFERQYYNSLIGRISGARDGIPEAILYLYNMHDTKNEMLQRRRPFDRVVDAFIALSKLQQKCPGFVIKSFSEPGNPLTIGDQDFNLWMENPSGRFLSISISSKRYADDLYESYRHSFSRLPSKSIDQLSEELRPREARKSIFD